MKCCDTHGSLPAVEIPAFLTPATNAVTPDRKVKNKYVRDHALRLGLAAVARRIFGGAR